MIKETWSLIVRSIGEMKGGERKLLFIVLFLVILNLYLGFRDNTIEKTVRIHDLEQDNIEILKSKETQRVLMQDKIDDCNSERYKDLQKTLEHAQNTNNRLK
jgi:hypothetical protein